jgi:hypothetical protein
MNFLQVLKKHVERVGFRTVILIENYRFVGARMSSLKRAISPFFYYAAFILY